MAFPDYRVLGGKDMRLLYENLIERLVDTGLSRKEAEHLFILAIEDVVVSMDDRMLAEDDNFLTMLAGIRKNPLS